MTVCQVDGVEVAAARTGRLVHLGELPRGTDPAHEIVEVEADAYEARQIEETDLHVLASELLDHHASLHPLSECPFGQRVSRALRSGR